MKILCWRDTAPWPVVLVVVLVLVLDPLGSKLQPTFDYENEDEDKDKDEKLSTGNFKHSPFMSLHSNYPPGATFSDRNLGKSLVSIY